MKVNFACDLFLRFNRSGLNRYRYIVYIALLLPVFFFRDLTPANELKYISIVNEALENGTWFTFYNHGAIYADKPPLFFWLVMLSKMLTGHYYTACIGLFNLLPAIGVLWVMSKWLKEERIVCHPVMAELLLLTTGMFAGASLIVRMDMLMTFFIVLSLYTFFRIYKKKHTSCDLYLLPIYIFLGVFSKGAMGFLIPVVSMLSFLLAKKQLKTFAHYLGWKQWSILFVLFALWFMAVFAEGGTSYLNNLVFKQTVGRGIDSFHHKEPFWFYFSRILFTFAPWSLLYVVLIGKGIKKRVIKGDVRMFFALIAGVNLMVLSLISSKIDIYLLPLYPFVVYLCASLLAPFEQTKAVRFMVYLPAALAVLAFPVSFFVAGKISYAYDSLFMVHLALLLLFASGLVALFLLKRKQIQRAILSLSCGMLGGVFLASFALPQFNKYFSFEEMATEAYRVGERVGVSEYTYYKFSTAPNIDVYLGGKEVKKITLCSALDSLIDTGKKTILFVRQTEIRRDPDFAHWLENKQPGWQTERYRWYLLN